jgi:integrase
MARVRDLWFARVTTTGADGKKATGKRKTARHPDRGGNKNAKRWLAIWITPDGAEATKAFATQDAAKKYAAKMEADAARDEYIDPKRSKDKFGPLAEKYLRLRSVGRSSRAKYRSAYRCHVEPEFAGRYVRSVKATEILEWLRDLGKRRGDSLQELCYLILAGTFDLAVADKMRNDNPARSPIVPKPRAHAEEREPWGTARVWQVVDEHPEPYRAIPQCAAGLGLREGCAFALAEEDFDFDAMKVRIRRQVVRVGGAWYFKLPKGGKERVAPLSRGLAAVVRAHIEKYPPQPYTLPWLGEKAGAGGEPHTCRILFRWHGGDPKTSGLHIGASSYDQAVWKPALSRAGVIPAAVPDGRGIRRYRGGSGKGNGMHALRHYYSTTLQNAAVPLVGVMEFMGHSRKGMPVTLGVYGHVTDETFELARAAIDRTLFRLRPVEPAGTVTELRSAR